MFVFYALYLYTVYIQYISGVCTGQEAQNVGYKRTVGVFLIFNPNGASSRPEVSWVCHTQQQQIESDGG